MIISSLNASRLLGCHCSAYQCRDFRCEYSFPFLLLVHSLACHIFHDEWIRVWREKKQKRSPLKHSDIRFTGANYSTIVSSPHVERQTIVVSSSWRWKVSLFLAKSRVHGSRSLSMNCESHESWLLLNVSVHGTYDFDIRLLLSMSHGQEPMFPLPARLSVCMSLTKRFSLSCSIRWQLAIPHLNKKRHVRGTIDFLQVTVAHMGCTCFREDPRLCDEQFFIHLKIRSADVRMFTLMG